MSCNECDRLRRENRELREELHEYRATVDGEDPLAFNLKVRFRLRPQQARVLAALVKNPGRIMNNLTLVDASGYVGEENNPDKHRAQKSLRPMISQISRHLEDARLFDVIQTFYGQGRMISTSDAERIRAMM